MATAKGLRTQRYRPAAEFDNITLAKKREYWRTKKREQRAKVAAVRKKFAAVESNFGVRDAKRDSLAAHVEMSIRSPPLLNGDTTCLTKKCDSPASSLLNSGSVGERISGSSTGKTQNAPVVPQKVRWFQRIKLNRVLPKFSEESDNPQSGVMAVGCRKAARASRMGPPCTSSTVINPSGSSTRVNDPVPIVCINATPTTTSNNTAVMNGNFTHQRTCSSELIKDHKASVGRGQGRVGGDIGQHPLEFGNVNAKPKPCAFTAIVNMPQHGQAIKAPPETEEEKAARRREVWRIKKREQRAKQAAKLVKEQERLQRVDLTTSSQTAPRMLGRPMLGRPRLPSQGEKVALNHTHIKSRIPYGTSLPRQTHNHKGLSGSTLNMTDIASRKKIHGSSMTNVISNDAQLSSLVMKTGEPKQPMAFLSPTQATGTSVLSNNMNLGVDATCTTRGILAPFSNTPRYMSRPKVQAGRFLRTQKLLRHRNPRASFPGFQENPEETAEERMARKREYWRVKKREQRAKLSTEVKAKLRERDSLLRRVKRYQSILEEMRRARAESQKGPPAKGNLLKSTSEPIGGFIKEDGTVTVRAPTLSSSPSSLRPGGQTVVPSKPLPPLSHHVSTGNTGFTGHINLNLPPLHRGPVPPRNTCPVRVTVPAPPKLVCIRPRFVGNKNQNKFRDPYHTTTKVNRPAQCQVQGMTGNAANQTKLGHVSRSGSIPSAVIDVGGDEELTEEERIARRREYWRIKKREQRAKRAARFRQGLMRGRAIAARRRRQSPSPGPGLVLASPGFRVQTRLAKSSVATVVNASSTTTVSSAVDAPLPVEKVKVECEILVKEEPKAPSVVDDTHGVEVKPCLSPPPCEPTSEVDPPGSADTQATTLLAVASMKKLLEESLSTVASEEALEVIIKTEEPQCKTEAEDVFPVVMPPSSPDVKPNLMSEVGHSVSDNVQESICFSSEGAYLQNAENLASQTPPVLPVLPADPLASQDVPPPTFDPTPKDTLTSVVCTPSLLPASAIFPDPYPPVCLPCTPPHGPPQGSDKLTSIGANLRLPRTCSKTLDRNLSVHQQPTPSDSSDLQRKREYWRLMKRQQRARKAQEKSGPQTTITQTNPTPQAPNYLACSQRLSQNNYPNANLPLNKSPPSACALNGKAHSNMVNSMPQVHVARLPVSSSTHHQSHNQNSLHSFPSCGEMFTQPTRHQEGSGTVQHGLSVPALPSAQNTGSPPPHPAPSLPPSQPVLLVENEKAPSHAPTPGVRHWSLQVQPRASSGITTNTDVNVDFPNPIAPKPPSQHPLNAVTVTMGRRSSFSTNPIGQPVVPDPSCKLTQNTVNASVRREEDDDDVMRRKREYWRVKKKEQRARKAARERGLGHLNVSSPPGLIINTQHMLPQDINTQAPRQWFNSEGMDMVSSSQVDMGLSHLSLPSHVEPINDELGFGIQSTMEHQQQWQREVDEEEENGDNLHPNGTIYVSTWRSRYLMDYDQLNQLLVCMVCGEQQYCHTPEGALAHIEEAHPHTLSLDQAERYRLQEVWDKQVAQREQFFTSQLQQHSASANTPFTGRVAEVEVTVDMEDSSQSGHCNLSRTKNIRRF